MRSPLSSKIHRDHILFWQMIKAKADASIVLHELAIRTQSPDLDREIVRFEHHFYQVMADVLATIDMDRMEAIL